MNTWKPSPWARRLKITSDWSLQLDNEHVAITQHNTGYVTCRLWEVSAIRYAHGAVWSSCHIALSSPGASVSSVTLKGLTKQNATEVVEALRSRLNRYLLQTLKTRGALISRWRYEAFRQLHSDRWNRRSLLDRLHHERDHLFPAGEISNFRLSDHPALDGLEKGAVEADALGNLRKAYSTELTQKAELLNHRFEQAERLRHEAFFERVESRPLTDEQTSAAICFDDRVRLIAPAGSGKTSTMVARAGYAIRAGIARPEQILLLAYNSDAASELRERLDSRLAPWVENPGMIQSSTFHAFGLRVIGEATGRKPHVPAWLGNGQDMGVMTHILQSLNESSAEFRSLCLLFSAVMAGDIGTFQAQKDREDTVPLAPTHPEAIVTHRGEVVKSQEEKIIADWLTLNGIDYRYENPYYSDTSDAEHGQYHPDFYYPDADLYHEHLALDASGQPPASFKGYMAGVEWKRQLHHAAGNRYIETTSADLRSGKALGRLKAQLEAYGLKPVPSLANLGERAEPISIPELAKTMRTFLQHYKGNQVSLESLRKRAASFSAFPYRAQIFVRMFEFVFDAWNQRLSNEGAVDFDDMLGQAAQLIESGQWQNDLAVVCVDEFQDTSHARARIVRALQAPSVSTAAIGDDFQAIYRFAGSDIKLMTGFDQCIGPATTRYLTCTFRCPQSLNDVASAFVSANPEQIPKEIRSENLMPGIAVRCVLHPRFEGEATLFEQLDRLAAQAREESHHYSVFLLGRYRHDCPKSFGQIARQHKSCLTIRFSTIHQSKGLEADYVFILNVHAGRIGFPSTIVDEPLMGLVMPEPEQYPNAEERRLMYVAITRARRHAILLAEKGRESPFIPEMARMGMACYSAEDSQTPLEICHKCNLGFLVLRTGKHGVFKGCSRYPACQWLAQG